MIDSDMKLADEDRLIRVSKPIFYGFVFMAAVALNSSTAFSGTLLGVAIMSSICFIAAGISDMVNDDWQRVLQILALVSLLGALLSGAYLSAILSMS